VTANARATASEDARKREAATAVTAYEGLQETCTAGLALAVTRGRTIERIVSTPARPDGLRGIVGAGELRDVVGQAPDAHGRP